MYLHLNLTSDKFIFVEQEIFVEELKIFPESWIFNLNKFFKLGTLTRFNHALTKWKNDLSSTSQQNTSTFTSTNHSLEKHSVPETRVHISSSIVVENQLIHLDDILKNRTDGEIFLIPDTVINEKSRPQLCSLIVNHFIQIGKRMTTKQAELLAMEIVKKFKEEHMVSLMSYTM